MFPCWEGPHIGFCQGCRHHISNARHGQKVKLFGAWAVVGETHRIEPFVINFTGYRGQMMRPSHNNCGPAFGQAQRVCIGQHSGCGAAAVAQKQAPHASPVASGWTSGIAGASACFSCSTLLPPQPITDSMAGSVAVKGCYTTLDDCTQRLHNYVIDSEARRV
jgi:hypothetical protein